MRLFAAFLCLVVGSASAGFIEGTHRDGATIIAHSGGSRDSGLHGGPSTHVRVDPGSVLPVVQGQQVHAAGPKGRLHEIHTHSAKTLIRVEEFARPHQVIRVHEAPLAAPEVIRVKGPSELQSLIRIVAKSPGPAHVERVVHRPREVQVINVQKPAAVPARIIHVIRGAPPPPKVEFIDEPEQQSHIYVAQAPAGAEVVLATGSPAPGSPSGRSSFVDGGSNGGASGSIVHEYYRGPVVAGVIQALPQTSSQSFVSPVSTLKSSASPGSQIVSFASGEVLRIQDHSVVSYAIDPSSRTKITEKYHPNH